MKKYLFLVIAALTILYFLSSMPYEKQTIVPELKVLLDNQPFYETLSKIEVNYWGRTISVETRGYYYFIEFLIRKTLHFTGYGIVAVLLYMFFRKMQWPFAAIFACVFVFFIAMLDEYNQTLVEGRTGIFEDVLLDTAGAVTFILCIKGYHLIRWLLLRKRA
ncbi:VanZ family protein [Ureibacillus sp. FSL K6-8385]|uniref:VanZ family protein n=1 Tax=Ureibacillus terrenus TaxID=118246 RepID=A0A540V6T4_9BACL|nr:VanZ family protein [Ureibacillus terrenus]MED3660573.1 VanZ family protein [Ureibacillus terrenus]MED3762693.1 VanZ family protein [Ureibacillus terrenus]TQE92431.1 VanZ family protein [Ureibacillus terrenus]